ncbi:MAG: histidine phosphatase family protein [Candidatus Cohnella colombiensis]|uniref:Histidine phosphatase family protein n=1 Tax=Candidatus Cohnella colombiensis TaxID=3121368 RepID=A0AA95JES7_9BACL|nr:MAG: histidine phosphatase family protein [Cohnella sp.]
MKRIYLIRHCKAKGQDPNTKLTTEGEAQAEQLADILIIKQIDYIVSSPFERAISSIKPLADILNLNIHIDDRLCERVLSTVELEDWMELLKDTFENLELKLSGGESSRDAMTRGVSVIEELYRRSEQNIAVVTHGNLMTLILKYFEGSVGFNEWRSLTNPDIYEIVKPIDGKAYVNRVWATL